MKHIKLFEDIVSWDLDDKPKMGSPISDDDEHLMLIKDLVLELEDNGFRVIKKGYYGYHEGYIVYDIIVNKNGTYQVFDINDVNKINIDLSDVNTLNESMKDINSRLIENGLYLGSYSINVKDNELYSFTRLFRRIDGEPVTDFTYNTDD